MTKDAGWVLAQFALAWVLVAVSGAGLVAEVARGVAALLFWAVLPGAAVWFVVNGILMRRRGDDGLATYEKIAIPVQVVLLGAIAAVVLASGDGTFLGLLYGVPLYALLAAVVTGMAIERNRSLTAPQD